MGEGGADLEDLRDLFSHVVLYPYDLGVLAKSHLFSIPWRYAEYVRYPVKRLLMLRRLSYLLYPQESVRTLSGWVQGTR
jgi:hypothetical protein